MCKKQKKTERERLFKALVEETVVFLPIALGYIISMLLFKATGLPQKEYSWIIVVSTIGVAIMLMVLYVKIEKKISKAFHKSI